MSPEKYNGEGDWEEYINQFEDVSEWNGWTKHEKATQLCLHLTGVARSVMTDLSKHVTGDYDLLVPTLAKYFSSTGREAAFQAEFRQRKRSKAEKLSDFGHDLTRLCKRAFPKMERSAREQFVIERFKQGLDTDLRRHIQFSHPDSLEMALVAGMEYEVMSEEGDRVRKPIAAIQSTVTPMSDINTQALEQLTKMSEINMQATKQLVENMQNMQQTLTNRKTPSSGTKRDWSQVECYSCHQRGHLARNCLNSRNSQNRGPNNIYPNAGTQPGNAQGLG